MIVSKRLICIALLFHAVFSLSTVGVLPAGEEAEVVQLAEHIYRITFPYSLRTNIGLSAGSDGIMLVDTGFEETAEALKRLIQNLEQGDIKYIINTHPHPDHVGGTWICGQNATIIDHENLDACLSYGIVFPGNGDMEGRLEELLGTYYSLNFNGDKIQIIPCSGIHSDEDLMVYFSLSGVVHMGDLLLTQSFPAVGAHVKEYMAFLQKAIDLFPPGTKFIAGHGCDCTLSELKVYRKMLLTTIEIVCKEMNEGKNLEQIQSEKVLKRWESWGEFLPFLNTDTWIESIYKSYY
ncbi:MAG: MBL fold metallo-hydrolase [Candidatus Aminicenantes bacterium]|nr:MBL fold metallo-hydrolase [Candidatus Aminicenantes bacterium]